MKRIYEDLAYTDVPIRDRYWDLFLPDPAPYFPAVTSDLQCEFAVIGGGYTGLSAAIRLAQAGGDVVLLDAQSPGWGASGRNGGLVSVGGSKLEDKVIAQKYGRRDAGEYFKAERAAVDFVEEFLATHDLSVDRHSDGYTYVAHNAKNVAGLKEYGQTYTSRYGLPYRFVPKEEMAAQGMNSPDFHAAVHLPIGFALNPMKFVLGLTDVAQQAGVRIHSNSPVTSITESNGYVLKTPGGQVHARKLIIATNGYSADDLPQQIANRFLPVQSNILVTRPMSGEELAAQGWTSRQMLVDTRNLLHYFRLLPDNRMLLGLRGSVRVTPENIARTRAIARRDFDRMFPNWHHVETSHFWSGLICMTREFLPFAGAVAGQENMRAAFGFHGNGVTMAPYAGALVADQMLGRKTLPHPDLMQRRLKPFELGRWRRMSLPPAFAWYRLKDRL